MTTVWRIEISGIYNIVYFLSVSESFAPLTETFSISTTTKSVTPAFLRSSTGHALHPRQKLKEHRLRSLYSWRNLERSMNQSYSLRTDTELKRLKETSQPVPRDRMRGNKQKMKLETMPKLGWIQSWTKLIVSMAQQITSTPRKFRNVPFVVSCLEVQILQDVSVWMEPQFW